MLEVVGGLVDAIDGHAVAAASAAGDETAARLIGATGRDLGAGIAGLVAVFDPEVVVIGGGLLALDQALLGPAIDALLNRLVGAGHRRVTALRPADLGGSAALTGAALLPYPRA
jgi:glucokinase